MYLVRHGETDSNRTHTIQGHLDTSLSETGIEQAKLVAKYLANTKFSVAISSDLQRALKTGELIRDANSSYEDIEVWKVLKERSFGNLEGQDVKIMLEEVKDKSKEEIFLWGPDGGETGSEFRERVRNFIRDLGKRMVKYNEENEHGHKSEKIRVIITSHGGFIKEFNTVVYKEYNCKMPEKSNGQWGRICPNTGISIYHLIIDNDGALKQIICKDLHFTGHLKGVEINEPVMYGV